MRFPTKAILSLILMFPITCAAVAQETSSSTTTSTAGTSTTVTAPATTTTAAPATTTTAASTSGDDSEQLTGSERVREDFTKLLREKPSELGTILALDPTLLSNEGFLAPYPEVASFIAAHPEVRHNPRYYLSDFHRDQRGEVEAILEPVTIFAVFALLAFALAWLVRTLIEQKRWNRLSRTQADVHNKILDRFGTTGELLEYIKTPAGTKFLESAPIPLHSDSVSANAPATRVLWSVQIGVVVAAAAIGLLIVSGRLADESGRAFFGLGVIALCVGAGFVLSAFISLLLSRRLGVWQPQGDAE